MSSTRLEAFSDGVIAIIITIMVLEMKVPHGDRLDELWPIVPVFLSYVLSFVYVGIYWNNHHHMLHATSRVTGGVLWGVGESGARSLADATTYDQYAAHGADAGAFSRERIAGIVTLAAGGALVVVGIARWSWLARHR